MVNKVRSLANELSIWNYNGKLPCKGATKVHCSLFSLFVLFIRGGRFKFGNENLPLKLVVWIVRLVGHADAGMDRRISWIYIINFGNTVCLRLGWWEEWHYGIRVSCFYCFIKSWTTIICFRLRHGGWEEQWNGMTCWFISPYGRIWIHYFIIIFGNTRPCWWEEWRYGIGTVREYWRFFVGFGTTISVRLVSWKECWNGNWLY